MAQLQLHLEGASHVARRARRASAFAIPASEIHRWPPRFSPVLCAELVRSPPARAVPSQALVQWGGHWQREIACSASPGPRTRPKALQQPACRGQRRRETPRPSVDVSCSAVVSSVEAWREIERLPGRGTEASAGRGARWASNFLPGSRCDSGPAYICWTCALAMDGVSGSSSENIIASRRS